MNAADVVVVLGKRGDTYHRHPQMAYDYDANGNVSYVGIAPKGEATSAAKWLIFNLTYNASSMVTAIKSAPDDAQIWDNRATLTYT